MARTDWPALRMEVLIRDGARCMAPVLDDRVSPADCRDRWGNGALWVSGSWLYPVAMLTLDHVHHHAGGTKGKKAPDDAAHLVTLCWFHHLEGWATSRRGRELERAYLKARGSLENSVDSGQQPY